MSASISQTISAPRKRLRWPGMSKNQLRKLIILVPYLWMGLFVLAPFVIVLKIAVSQPVLGVPPFSPLYEWTLDGALAIKATIENLFFVVSEPRYMRALLNSIYIAGKSTLICLAIGFPAAYAIARTPRRWRNLLLLAIILPFWTSYLLRIYALIGLLENYGPINRLVMWLGISENPLPLLHTSFAVQLGIVFTYLPLMIMPLYATLEKLDITLEHAAADLGATPRRVFWDVTVPLAIPGILAGSLLVFIPALGEYVIPTLLGNARDSMIGRSMLNEFFVLQNWPVASAIAVLLLILVVPPIMLMQRMQTKQA